MSHKDRLLDAIEKASQWIPYEGPYGGAGWQNTATGEIRYQDTKPGTEDSEDPVSYEEAVAEQYQVDPEEDPMETDLGRFFEEGQEVQVDSGFVEDAEGPVTTEVMDIGEDGAVQVEDPEQPGATFQLLADDLAGESVEEIMSAEPPETGWADGWMETPERLGDLEENQLLEVYDNEAGEYVLVDPYVVVDSDEEGNFEQDAVEGKVVTSDAWEPDEDAEHQEGDKIEITGDSDTFVTAAEDPDYDPYDILDPLTDNEVADLSEGDEVVMEFADGDREEATVAGTPTPESTLDNEGYWSVEMELEDGTTFEYETNDDYQQAYDHTETGHPEEVLEWDGEMHWEATEGNTIAMDHPAFGEVQGDAELSEDPHGGQWLTVQTEDGEDASLSLDPEHPLYAGSHVTDTENVWDTVPTEPDDFDAITPGSQVLVEDEEGNRTVETVTSAQYAHGFDQPLVDTSSGESYTDADDIVGVDSLAEEEMPDVPWSAESDEWQSVGSGFHGTNTGDTVLYSQPGSGELEQGEITAYEDGGDSVIVDNTTRVTTDSTVGVADTGSPLPDTDYRLDEASAGDVVQGYRDEGGEAVEFEGMVLAESYGDLKVTDGEHVYHMDEDDLAVETIDDDADTSEFRAADGMETPTEEIASDLSVNLQPKHGSNYLSKAEAVEKFWAAKEDQKDLKDDFKRYFDPGEVEGFYDSISSWKSSSSHQQKLESAFAYARDLDARVRDTAPDEDLPYAREEIEEWVKMADVAAEMSQQWYDEYLGEWYRGGHTPSLRSAFADYLEDPSREEYEVDGRALNNGSPNPGNSWNDWRMAPGPKVESDQVMLATDFMFNPEANHGNEDEVWVTADGLTVNPEDIHIRHEQEFNLANDPSTWTDVQAENIIKEIAQETPMLFDDIGSDPHSHEVSHEIERDREPSDSQLETMYDLAKEAEERGISSKHINEMHAAVEQQMKERGLLEESESPVIEELEGYEPADFEGILDENGAVPAKANFQGYARDGYIIGADNGSLEFESDGGGVYNMSMEDITWVDDLELPGGGGGVEYDVGDAIEVPMFGSPVEVVDVDPDGNSVVVEDANGHEYVEDLDHPDMEPTEVMEGGVDDASDTPEPPDTETFLGVEDNSPESVAGIMETGDWVTFEPSNFDDPVVGQVSGMTEMAGGDYVYDVDHPQSLGEQEFPLNSYTGNVAEVTSVGGDGGSAEGSDEASHGPPAGDFEHYDTGFIDPDQYAWEPLDEVDDDTVSEGDEVALVMDYDHFDDKTVYVGEAIKDVDGSWDVDVSNHDEPTYNLSEPVNDNDVEAYMLGHESTPEAESEDMLDEIEEDFEDIEPDPDDGAPSPADLPDMDLSAGEMVSIEDPNTGGFADVEVIEPAAEEGDPVAVESQATGSRYLVWPDGEMESVHNA